ncbi:hypothetical protein BH09PLA1_BH09PLA1_10820 [soil metagenome]
MTSQFVRVACFAYVLIVLLSTHRVLAAPFVNLDFEQATVVHTDPNFPPAIDAAAAFPGWIARVGDSIRTNVTYNYRGGGQAVISLYDRPASDIGFPLLQGQYMAVLISDSAFGSSASLAQTGDVPAGTRSITFLGEAGRGAPSLLINGTAISTVNLTGNNGLGQPAKFGADLTPFAGQTVELRLSSISQHAIDDFSFSTTPIPEPQLAILGLAVALVTRRRR